MLDVRPAIRRPIQLQPIQRRQVVQIAAAAAAAAFALGYLVSDLNHDAVAAMARHMVTVAAVMLLLSMAEIRVTRHLQEIRRMLSSADTGNTGERAEAYAQGYVDGRGQGDR